MSTIENDVLSRVSGDSVTAKNAIKGKTADEMGMDDFFTLLAAQMSNQDFMDPQSNTEYVAQMAQFTTLQGMQTIQEYQLSNYAVSYAGKDVTIAAINQSTGDVDTIKGTVEKVTFYDGAPQVVVNGKAYPLHQVMEITSDVTAKNEQNAGNSLNLVAGYIGKIATVTDTTDPEFPKEITGEVTSVTLKGGKPYVILDNGNEYVYTSIISVTDKQPATDTETETGTGKETGTGDVTGTDTETEKETETDSGTSIVTPSESDKDDDEGSDIPAEKE